MTVFARGAEPLAGNKEAVAGQWLSPSGEFSHRSTPSRQRHSICSLQTVMYITVWSLADHVCFAERAVVGDSREQEFGQIEADEAAVQHEFGDGSADDGCLLHSVS